MSNLFNERERAALEYAEAITFSDLEVTDDVLTRVRQQFDDDATVDLTALIAFQNMSSKFNAALDVPPQGFCRVPAGIVTRDNDRGRSAPVQSAQVPNGGSKNDT